MRSGRREKQIKKGKCKYQEENSNLSEILNVYIPWINRSIIDSGLCLSFIIQLYSPLSDDCTLVKNKL